MPSSKIVDSWALLAWLRDEQPAANQVRACIQQAEDGKAPLLMSWINAGEVYYMLVRKHDSKAAQDFLARMRSLPIRLVLPTEEDVVAAAKLKSTTGSLTRTPLRSL
jgi:predicted nucleic acid-binding protein